MISYDPTSLLSNLKRTFSGFGAQAPANPPLSIPKPTPFAMPKATPFTMPTAQPSSMVPAPTLTPPQTSGAFVGPVRPSNSGIQPPTVARTQIAPPLPKTTSTGQTINTATGGVTAGSAIPTPPVAPVPTPEAPTAPVMPTAEQTAVTSAEQAYKTAGMRTPEEDSAQSEIDRLNESFRAGYEGAGQQAIPMEFITGQQKAIEQRGLRLAEPLTAKLARLEAKRLSGMETSKFALERADKALETTRGTEASKAATTESARRFGIEQAGSADTRALAEKKFAQDAKQFGMEYALKKRELSIKESEASLKANEGKMTTAMSQDLQDKAKNIQTLIDDPYLKTAVGPNALARTSLKTGFTGGRQNFVGGVKQLTSKETLDTLITLKAKGGTLGALSDQERLMLQNAATKIGEWEMKENGIGQGFYNVDEASFKKELGTLKMLTERALTNAGVSTVAAAQNTGAPAQMKLPNNADGTPGAVVTRQADGTYK